MSYLLHKEKNNLLVKFSEVITYKEILSSNDEVLGKSYFEKLEFLIWDLLEVDEVDLSETEIWKIAHDSAGQARWNRNLSVTILSNECSESFARQWAKLVKALGSNWKVLIMDDIENMRSKLTEEINCKILETV